MTAPVGRRPGSDERKKAVKRYFQITPDEHDRTRARHQQQAAVVSVVVAGSLLLVGIQVLAILVAMLALVLALQGLSGMADYRRRLAAAEPKPSDQEMDDTLKEDLHAAAERAMRRLGLTRNDLELHSDEVDPPAEARRRPRLADQGRGPLVVFGPSNRARGRSGADRVWRFTLYDVMVICPTGHHLGIYKCVLDFASGSRKDEETYEFHYTDVVGVLTRTRERAELGLELVYSSSIAVPLHRTMTREFEIVVSSGDRSAIVVGIRDDERLDQQLVLQESGIDRVTAAVRRMLRAKKGAPTR
ncbi:hypothetical protein [Pseudonocardia alaniniphila]|uniref:Uncharacterized protein n=1 Tax=Pseudonocardia alaniniphila TaxID=75291 RepID=A0ABS9T8R9_9PSEU|nr:hypothetical protein [Pseudonocardia alaniniphila]MCH6164939.1 hypothetical protein [Pseudonocardia alaniniphila]